MHPGGLGVLLDEEVGESRCPLSSAEPRLTPGSWSRRDYGILRVAPFRSPAETTICQTQDWSDRRRDSKDQASTAWRAI